MIKIQPENIAEIVNNHYLGVKNLIRLELFNKKEKNYIESNIERIIKAKNDEYKTISQETKNFNHKKLTLAFVGSQKVKKHKPGSFNGYMKFSNKSTSPYNAYNLAEALQVNVCPYCNRNYTNTIKSVYNKSTRPEFDHFICKTKYPIFALSFYNLIPSCSICNSSIKGQSQFDYSTHINPYFDDFNQLKKFNVDKTLLSLLTKKDEFKIIFEDRIGISPEEKIKADNHIRDFALEAAYASHKDKVLELVDLSRAYTEASFENIVNEFQNNTQIFKDVNEVKRLLLCHHIEDENIDKRPLNKLMKDIAEELKLL